MAAVTPMTDAELARIRELHGQRRSLSSIADELGRSKGTVGRHAKAMGLTWDTSRTAPATEVKQASNRERRAKLVSRLYDRAEHIMDRLDSERYKLVGLDKDGYAHTNVVDQDAIPAADERALSGLVVNLLAGAARMEQVDAATNDQGEAKGILGRLDEALQGAYAQLSHTGSARGVDLEHVDATDTD